MEGDHENSSYHFGIELYYYYKREDILVEVRRVIPRLLSNHRVAVPAQEDSIKHHPFLVVVNSLIFMLNVRSLD